MRPDDLVALKKYKLKKSNSKAVDRKASKGRKIRYVVHNKIQNFMFPVPFSLAVLSSSSSSSLSLGNGEMRTNVDSDRLFHSLFQ
jgi:hypothetical protein